MPTYEYRCPDGHDFEKFTQKMSDAQSELPCPTCGKVASRRISAGGGLHFKGSGFYITDYGKDGKKDQRAAAKTDGAAGGAADKAAPAAASSSGSTVPAPASNTSNTSSTSNPSSTSGGSGAPKSPGTSAKPKPGPEK